MTAAPLAAYAVVRGCLVVTLLGEVCGEGWSSLQGEVLARVARQRTRGVVLDASAVQVLDPDDGRALGRLLATCRLLGARALVVGLSVALVATLAEWDDVASRLDTEASVESALQRLWTDGDDSL